ncbi:MAG: MFS transporter [Planctomycetes bacterium]|nr:MFS transporter [Planctomycetota bacterium]
MDALARRNAACFVAGESLWGLAMALVASSTVLTVALREYGADERMIGSIAAIEGGLIFLPQLIGAYLFTSRKHRKARVLWYHLLTMIPVLAGAGVLLHFAPQLPPVAVRWGLLLAFAAFMGAVGVIVSVWHDWMASLFPARARGTVIGLVMFASAGMGSVGGLLAGWLLKHYPDCDVFAWLYFAAAATATVSLLTYFLVDDPAARMPESQTQRLRLADFLARFRASLAERNFRNFLIGRVLATSGFSVLPLVAVYYGSPAGGALSKSVVVSCGAALTLGIALSNLVLGHLGDERGHRLGIVIGAVAQIAVLALLLWTAGEASCMAAYFLAGVCVGSSLVSHLNMLLETCPHDHRLSHITVGNLVLSVPLLSAPIAAGFAAEAYGLRPVFAGCAVVSAAALLWILFFVRDPRHMDLYPQTGPDESGPALQTDR